MRKQVNAKVQISYRTDGLIYSINQCNLKSGVGHGLRLRNFRNIITKWKAWSLSKLWFKSIVKYVFDKYRKFE